MKRPIKIAITSGDPDGIGFEIVSKALARIGPKQNVLFYLWRSPSCSTRDLRRIDGYFRRITVSSWPEALKATPSSSKELVDICSNLSPAHWVEASGQAAQLGHIDGIATAPLSKTEIKSAGLKDIGHTDILKRVSKSSELFMSFLGDKFNVLLATGHLSTHEATSILSAKRLELAVRAADRLRRLAPQRSEKPIAILGLNPHAGEEGLIGDEERKVHLPVIEKLRKDKLDIEGPLVPDAAFDESNWKKYSVYVANYHDQGLIPFKLVHQRRGVHITMGLPFVRTSVDHGTAKDIFGKNKADYRSMLEALKWAIALCRANMNQSETME